MQLFYQPEISKGHHFLSQEESRHAVKVLRQTPGDLLNITDGFGSFYQATIVEANQKKCSFTITEQTKVNPCPIYRHIAIAPTKNMDRFEWFVEKATEFGIDRITPILCHNSERRIVKVDRIRKKAVSAMKQSIKAFNPVIDELMSFQNCLQIDSNYKFIAHVDNTNPTLLNDQIEKKGSHLILIGPEGDFSDKEIELAVDGGFSKAV